MPDCIDSACAVGHTWHVSTGLEKCMPSLVTHSWAPYDHYESAHMFISELTVTSVATVNDRCFLKFWNSVRNKI
jgi:hypothetical protein